MTVCSNQLDASQREHFTFSYFFDEYVTHSQAVEIDWDQ